MADDERMADDDDSGGGVTQEWPLEGHFVVGGSGLYVSTDCLGRAFTSRTARYDLTIGLPQVDTRPDPIPQKSGGNLVSPHTKHGVDPARMGLRPNARERARRRRTHQPCLGWRA